MSLAEEEDKRTAGDMDVLDHEDYEYFSDGFKEIMRTKLTWHHLKAMDIWVFWIDDGDDDNDDENDDYDEDDDDESASLRTRNAGNIPDPALETPMANWRLNMKLRCIIRKLLMETDGCSLVQFWVPKTVGDRTVLTTADQPFGFSFVDETFCYLRMESEDLESSVDGEDEDCGPGIIAHVFKQHITAITPNVKYYTREEYPQRDDAVSASINSSIACPVIESSTKCCIGVIEILSTSVHLQASKIFRVIEDVGLTSSGIQGHSTSPVDYKSRSKAVAEIRNGVKVVCETHKLPLVHSWFRCKCKSCIDVKSEGSCLIRENLYIDYISYALDDSAKEFLRACSADPLLPILLKGQGVAGRALASYRPSFCRDVTRFNIAEYPLVHLARVFGLAGSFAICLRSSHTGDADYVLEFFLPRRRIGWNPKALLCSILETMKKQFPSFTAASGEELGQELSVEYIDILKMREGSAFQIVANSPRSAVQSMGDMMQLELPIPQLMVEIERQDKRQTDPIFSEDYAIGETIPNEDEATEAVVNYDAVEQHSGKKLDSVAESLGGNSWREDRIGDDLHGEEKTKKRKSTEEVMHGI